MSSNDFIGALVAFAAFGCLPANDALGRLVRLQRSRPLLSRDS